jgi:hypothetical protein
MASRSVPSTNSSIIGILIRVLPAEAAVRKQYDLTEDVETKTPPAKRKTVLAFAGWHAFQFLNVVRSGTVIRICGEDRYGALFGR